MYVDGLPNCCTAKFISAFDDDSVYTDGEYDSRKTQKKLREKILYLIKRDHFLALLIATTTDEQPEANGVLETLGFERTPFYSKDQHEDTRLAFWWGHIPMIYDKFRDEIDALPPMEYPKLYPKEPEYEEI